MSYSVARYALWILLCIPVFVLGFGLFGDLFESVLQESRAKKAKQDAEKKKEEQRRSFDEEYRRTHGSGF